MTLKTNTVQHSNQFSIERMVQNVKRIGSQNITWTM